jgi:hypothetical protein
VCPCILVTCCRAGSQRVDVADAPGAGAAGFVVSGSGGVPVQQEKSREPTCAVCLAEFDVREPVQVLPECLQYYHAVP